MKFIQLQQPPGVVENDEPKKFYRQFENLLAELDKKDLPNEVIDAINNAIEELNGYNASEKKLRMAYWKKQNSIIQLLEKQLKLVPKNHYRKRWLALGMTTFGIPIGLGIGAGLDNMAYLGIGILIGLAIGIAVGNQMDKKAEKEGRQLDLEI